MKEGDQIVHASRSVVDDTVHYVIDTRGSTFVVQAFATGLLSAFGHNPKIAVRDFQGNVNFKLTGLTLEDARLNLKIPAESLEVIDDISEKDRQEIHQKMCEEVLEAHRYPQIAYECSRVSASGSGDRYWVALNGELTLHGETHSVPVSARVAINGSSMRLRASSRSDRLTMELLP